MTVNSVKSPPQPLLVLDGEERASLAVVRSLVQAGFSVHVAAQSRWSLAGAAHGASAHLLSSHPLHAPDLYAREVAALGGGLDARLVIPVTDASAEAVLGNRNLMPPGLALPFASHAIYREASDKVRVHEIALECEIGIEESAIVLRQGDAAPAAALYPGYVKPHRSVVGGARRVKTGVRFVATREECERVLRELDPAAFPVLVQRRIVGPGEGVFLARWGGRTIARFAHRRLREKPPSGGVSVYRESIVPDPAVMAACERLLDALNWEGVAMIEGKRDLASGAWRVMEINGRFWGSLQLAIDAGVDFPSRLVRAVLGDNVGDPPAWTPGVRLRWEWGEVDHLLIRLRRSRKELNLPAEAPGKFGAVAAFLAHRPGRDRCEVLRLGDPLPFVVESLARLGIAR